MPTLEQLQQKLQEIEANIQQSTKICADAKAKLEQDHVNHYTLLGAQLFARQLVQEAQEAEAKAAQVVDVEPHVSE